MNGGINTYAYVGGNPVNQIDPLGLVKWTGSQITLGAIAGGGAMRYKFKLTSECINGKRGYAEVVAGGSAVGAGITFSGTGSKGVEFEDDLPSVNPYVFGGRAKFVGASWALGFMGYSWQAVQLGGAHTIGGGYQMGWDASVSGSADWATVTNVRTEGVRNFV